LKIQEFKELSFSESFLFGC